jgi:hypothetical protein
MPEPKAPWASKRGKKVEANPRYEVPGDRSQEHAVDR